MEFRLRAHDPPSPLQLSSGRTLRVCFSSASSLSSASWSWPLCESYRGKTELVSSRPGLRDVCRPREGGRTSASRVTSGTSSATSFVKSRSCLRGANPDMLG